MKKLFVLIAILGLAGCTTTRDVALEKTVVTVVKPSEGTYQTCPQSLDLPVATDTYSGRESIKTIYSGYIQCRQTVVNIKTEIDRLEKIATKDNPQGK